MRTNFIAPAAPAKKKKKSKKKSKKPEESWFEIQKKANPFTNIWAVGNEKDQDLALLKTAEAAESGKAGNGRLLQEDKTDLLYTLDNMPPVDAERIKFIERTAGPRDHWVYIVFKCKYDC